VKFDLVMAREASLRAWQRHTQEMAREIADNILRSNACCTDGACGYQFFFRPGDDGALSLKCPKCGKRAQMKPEAAPER
jgi:hypothetical protein